MGEPDLDLDLKAQANARDPFPVWAWLRENDPVHWSESLGAWVVTRYDDVRHVLDHPALFSADRFRKLERGGPATPPDVRAVGEVLGKWLVFRDPPDHTRLRGLLQRSFTPRQLARSRAGIQVTIDSLVDRVAERGRMDFIADFAFPLPAVVIAILLGAPKEDIESIKRWSDLLAAYLGGRVDGSDNWGEARAGVEALELYFRDLLRERRKRPQDDLMSLMLAAEDAGDRLSEAEVIANCVLLVFAGHETTTNLLGNGLFHLLRHPRALEALRRDPSLVANGVEELLRFDGPVPATAKVVVRDHELGGRDLRRGQALVPVLSSANRDPRRFDRADVLDVERNPAGHLSFGYGIHFCLGAPLARLEAGLAFETLLRRLPGVVLASGSGSGSGSGDGTEPPCFKPQLFLRGLESLAIRWSV